MSTKFACLTIVLELSSHTVLGEQRVSVSAQDQRITVAVLARCKGLEEGEVTGQLFGKLCLTLMRGNAQMISSRCQDADYLPAEIDGVQ